jgi:hypothetical protein
MATLLFDRRGEASHKTSFAFFDADEATIFLPSRTRENIDRVARNRVL